MVKSWNNDGQYLEELDILRPSMKQIAIISIYSMKVIVLSVERFTYRCWIPEKNKLALSRSYGKVNNLIISEQIFGDIITMNLEEEMKMKLVYYEWKNIEVF